ncbi:DUF3301 domain-containing protein [Aliidiomarina halalkaliphila]|uniref:DUF3301 domain-containing protein n=1 Tax=Aliidiomarina halalkaliphila TaxID=2593535 RepID=A0A552X4N1_9GAMM|nr:DUF3301 domain-containing protein [Aliidiomarina halalkaliphila]TRW49563.1 DUF3301 domain-containing protein [Aliidiomarina halalkaliphila]
MNVNLFELIVLLGLFLLAYLFWQWRLQEEFARQHAEALCKRHDLQLLDIARASGRPRFRPKTGWEACFVFGFSSDIQSRYEGQIWLLNRHLRDYRLPTYRQVTEPDPQDLASAPNSADTAQTQPTRSRHEPPAQRVRVSYGIPAPNPEAVKQRPVTTPVESIDEHPDDDIVDAVFKTPDTSPIQPFGNAPGNTEDGVG